MYARVGRLPATDAANAPLARCGHSLTACLSESSKKLILFGGATALENSAGGGAATGIRLAGATADVHCFDVPSGTWTKLTPLGEAPSPRAAHAATAVGSMVVMQARPFRTCFVCNGGADCPKTCIAAAQGGIGPAGLATDDLFVLDLAGTPRWHRVVRAWDASLLSYLGLIPDYSQRCVNTPNIAARRRWCKVRAQAPATHTCWRSSDNGFCWSWAETTATRHAHRAA